MITQFNVPYPPSRDNIRVRTGPSATGMPSEAAEFSHYNYWVPAPLFVNKVSDSCTVITNAITGGYNIPLRVFPTGVSWEVFYSMRRPRMWSDGQVTARIWYTGKLDTGNESYIATTLATSYEQDGDVLFSSPVVSYFAAPTPDVTGELMILRSDNPPEAGIGYIEVTTETDIVSLGIRRAGNDAADTYAHDFLLIGAEFVYRPRAYVKDGLPTWQMKE